jgi:hypothetical protein
VCWVTVPNLSFVERSPEKAGVGGSIPSLATIIQQLADTENSIWFQLVPIISAGGVCFSNQLTKV